jgi:hypothetical protein
MRKILFLGLLISYANIAYSQAYDGTGDNKTSIGANFQKGGIGLNFAFDRGLSDYLSYGFTFGFLLKSETATFTDGVTVSEVGNSEVFSEKIDVNARLNGHFGDLIGMNEMLDLYGGLNIGFRNLGAQVGVRYLISEGFGFFLEAGLPVSKYQLLDTMETNYFDYYDQPVLNIGIVISN